MSNLATTYMGLKLANPLVASSCPRTFSVDSVRRLEDAGLGAVVMKSIFEEEIRVRVEGMYAELASDLHPEALDYLRADLPMRIGPEQYLERLAAIKASVNIPVIASVNCVSSDQWVAFARQIEAAGADALELNVYDISADPEMSGAALESRHINLVRDLRRDVSLPLAVKIGSFYSSIAEFARQLDEVGVSAIVLFNRFFQPDIDIETMTLRGAVNYSHPEDLRLPLRWVAILRDVVRCDLSVSTGVHDAEGAIKALLAGANTVQICSILYQQGYEAAGRILAGLTEWMERKRFASVDEFRGRLRAGQGRDPRGFERVQYMKTLTGLK